MIQDFSRSLWYTAVCDSDVPCSRYVLLCSGVFRCDSPYLPLDLPHVDEVLTQLSGQQVLPTEDGQRPGGAVPSPVGKQTGAAVQVEYGAVPQLRAGVTAHYHFQRSRHVGSTTTHYTRGKPAAYGQQCYVIS